MSTTEESWTSPADDFNLHGWQPNVDLTDDENYMDIVFLITRDVKQNGQQQRQQGHMGSLIVRPSSNNESDKAQTSRSVPTSTSTSTSTSTLDDNHVSNLHKKRIMTGILGAATNLPLFGEKNCTSDIHAEISALGQACRSSQSTEGCTAYITIPPCKRCFAALVSFGIRRIVTRQVASKLIQETARSHGMEVCHLAQETKRRQMERINRLVNQDRTDEELMEIAERNKKLRIQRKEARKNKA